MRLERLVQVGDVGLVVLAVVDLHRLRVDVRLERVERVRQAGSWYAMGQRLLARGPDRPGHAGRARDRPRWPPAQPAKARSYTVDHVSTCLRGEHPGSGARHRPPSPAACIDSSAGKRADAGRFRPGSTRLPSRAREALRRRAESREPGDWMHRLAARPHHVGSPYGKDNAEFIAALFKSWGYETAIEHYHVLFPTPKVRVARAGRADEVRGEARGAGAQGRPDVGPDGASSCRPTTPTRATATSPRRSST